MIDCSLKEVPVNDRPSCWQLQGDVEEGSWWGHGALDLKRRKTGPAVQILLGQPCVCVGSWPASHFSFWDTAFRTIYSPGHSVRASSKSFSLSLFFPLSLLISCQRGSVIYGIVCWNFNLESLVSLNEGRIITVSSGKTWLRMNWDVQGIVQPKIKLLVIIYSPLWRNT